MAVVFTLLGLLLLVLAALYVLPLEWRLYTLAVMAVASLMAEAAACIFLRRRWPLTGV